MLQHPSLLCFNLDISNTEEKMSQSLILMCKDPNIETSDCNLKEKKTIREITIYK